MSNARPNKPEPSHPWKATRKNVYVCRCCKSRRIEFAVEALFPCCNVPIKVCADQYCTRDPVRWVRDATKKHMTMCSVLRRKNREKLH